MLLVLFMHGLLLINKPSGPSSFDILRELRKKLNVKKIGYLGTLDPLASGLLVFFLGKATRLIPYFEESDKEYLVKLEFGKSSDSYDITGKIEEHDLSKSAIPDKKALALELKNFLGSQWQIQPKFSALKYQGQRAYTLAREGKDFDLGRRQIEISEIDLLDFKFPQCTLGIKCSSGTYIRSLVHELGRELGLGAVMTGLRRTGIDRFELLAAVGLDTVSASNIIPRSEIIVKYIDWGRNYIGDKNVLLDKFA